MHQEAGIAEPGNIAAGVMAMESYNGAKQRTLLVVASHETFSKPLALAVQAEFPWIAVEQIETVEMACRSFARPVALILIEALLLGEAEATAAKLALLHPNARAAVIEANGRKPQCSLAGILKSKLVQGVLPMNMQLDVWLSVVRLMLHGGEYFPAEMLYPHRRLPFSKSRPMSELRDRAELTPREWEVLVLVAQGLQNKSIALRLNLSENTAKIHVHNIMRKLGAHNRTEAAAWLRDHEL